MTEKMGMQMEMEIEMSSSVTSAPSV